MKFTIEKTKLIEKLQNARATELKEIEAKNVDDIKEFQQELKEEKIILQAAIKRIDAGFLPKLDSRYRETAAPQPKTSSTHLEDLDSALSILSIISDEIVTLDDRADKWDLIHTLKAVL